MSWETLKSAVNAVITTNGNNEITAQVLRELLTDDIIPQLGEAEFGGIATASTDPGTPESSKFYITYTPGTYSNFDSLVVSYGLHIITNASGSWVAESLDVYTKDHIDTIEDDVSILKADVNIIKDDVDTLKDDVSAAENDIVAIKDGYDYSQDTTLSVNVTANTAVTFENGFIEIDLKSGKTATFTFNDPSSIIGAGTYFLYVRKASDNGWVAPVAINKGVAFQYTAQQDLTGFYVGLGSSLVLADGSIEIKYDYDEVIDSLIDTQATSIVESYDIVSDGNTLLSFNSEFGFDEYKRIYNNVSSIVVGGNNTKARYDRNIFNTAGEYPTISTVDDSFLLANGLENIDNDNLSATSGDTISYTRYIYAADGDLFDKLLAGSGKRFRLEVYVYSKHNDFPSVAANNTRVYSSGLYINAPLTAVEDTSSTEVKKLVFSGTNNFIPSVSYLYIEIRTAATSDYALGEFGFTGWKIGLFDSVSDESSKELIGDWEVEAAATPFTSDKAYSQDYSDYLYLVQQSGLNGYSFNKAEETKRKIAIYLNRYENKYVDIYNRLLVSFNGDSIIGSQLDDIDQSAEYLTGDFPPNMSKLIMARQFFDRYKFAGEDTLFRNLIHSNWTKTGFNISNGKDDASQTFNQIEVYGGADGDSAQITVSGYKYLKIVWSEYKGLNYSFDVLRSTNGGSTFTTVDTINVTSARRLMVAYKIYTITAATSYIYKIVPTSGYSNVCFWGVEMWNNPRLDVVMEAFSGSTAADQLLNKLDGYYSDYHKPALIITDILAINDYAVSTNVDNWISNLTQLYTFIKSKGIPIIAFGTHYPTTFVKMSVDLTTLQDIPVIDILGKMANPATANLQSITNGVDGLHLGDYGNTYYFDELKRIFG